MALECIQATPHIYSILLMIFLLYLQYFTHLNYLQNTLSSFSQHRRVYDRQPQALSGLTEFACKKDAYTIKVIIWHFETIHWFAFSLIVRWEDKCHVCDVVLSWFSMCCVLLLRKTGSGLQREKKTFCEIWYIWMSHPSIIILTTSPIQREKRKDYGCFRKLHRFTRKWWIS